MTAWIYLGQRTHFTFKLADLRYLNTIMHFIRNQLALCNSALTYVMTYAVSTLASSDYIEPQPTYSKNVLYTQLYEELKHCYCKLTVFTSFVCNKQYTLK